MAIDRHHFRIERVFFEADPTFEHRRRAQNWQTFARCDIALGEFPSMDASEHLAFEERSPQT